VNWINLAQDRNQFQALVNMVINLWAPKILRNFLTSSVSISSSRKVLLNGVS
jgi:hypothetical protein